MPDDILTATRSELRDLRLGNPEVPNHCYGIPGEQDDDAQRAARRDRLGPVWAYGLAGELALGAGFTVLAVRRLRAPARTLPRGTRVA